MRRPISPALEATYPAEGWYWVPPEHTWAVYLGANEISAAVKLTRMIEEELRAQ